MKRVTIILLLMLAMGLAGYCQLPGSVVIEPLPKITQMEYFFDTDPGFGNGTDVPISTDSIVDESFNVDASGLDIGRHLLYMRVLDDSGRWSLAYVTDIFKAAPSPIPVAPLPDIVAMEYFFDTDPGFGNGTDVSITADSTIDHDFDVDISSLEVGRHLVYFRTMDENGKWTLAYVTDLNKAVPSPTPVAPLSDIMAMEYFIGEDPGFGNGTDVPITADSIIDEDFNIDITMLEVGRYLLYFRSMDENGKWTLTYVTDINKATPPPSIIGSLPDIVAVEYFFDNDPGFGNGISVPVTADSLIDEDFNVDISVIDPGRHLLYLRTMDENGKWTLAFITDLNKLPATSHAGPLPDIVAMEYFFDTDPGYGNATPIAMTADSLVDVDFNVNVSTWGSKIHILYIRALDDLGHWSLYYISPISRGEISSRMRHGKFFFSGEEQPMYSPKVPD